MATRRLSLAPSFEFVPARETGGVVTAEPPHFYGISENWRDVPDAFSSPGWVRYCEALAGQKSPYGFLRKIYRRLVRGGDVPNYLAIPWRLIRGRSLSVIDVGGGYGDNYALMPPADVELVNWHVVDNERSVRLGREMRDDPRLSFSTDLCGKHDLALLVGTLQYVEDWRGFLANVASLGRPMIYISRSPIRVDGPSFLTMQAICPSLGPTAGQKVGDANVCVIGHADLASAMAAIGYRLREERFDKNCARHFARLPVTHHNIAYFSSLWESE